MQSDRDLLEKAAIDLALLKRMARSRVGNYVLPGLTSWIIGAPHDGGCVRMFTNEREQQDAITPHSHRFDFQCLVLSGKVTNRLWLPSFDVEGDLFARSHLVYDSMGRYVKEFDRLSRYKSQDRVFTKGEWYSMRAYEIHSIFFGAKTDVLFFEGPSLSNQSVVLEPYVDGEVVPTFEVRPWMFKKDAA